MDAFNDPKVKRIIGMFSAQVAKTTIIENVVGYYAHHDPSPLMVVLPTLEIAESFSKDRLAPMVRDTPALRARFAEAGSKSSGDTLLHKTFPGGHITLAGANSFNSLASRPIRIVIGDEAAKWKPNEKGSPFRQSGARVRGFWNSKLAYFSTPTDASPDNEFNEIWEQSDKCLFGVPCPHCGERIVYTFDETPSCLPTAYEPDRAVLKWADGKSIRTDDGRQIRRANDAWFECLLCRGRIDDVDRHRSVRQGEWFATQEFHGTRGYWGWQAMSPFSTALDIANDWLGALGSSVSLQSVKNETLGLPWVQQGEAPEWKRLFDRREGYYIGTVPDGVLFLTAGVDIQADRIEVAIWGWGRGKQCWLVDYYGIAASNPLSGDPSRPEVWKQLTQIIGTVYQHPSGADMPISKIAIDGGFLWPRVIEWARQNRFAPLMVVKGGTNPNDPPLSAVKTAELTVAGKRLDSGVKFQIVNSSFFTRELYDCLKLEAPNLQRGEEYQDRYIHLPDLPDAEEACRQITGSRVCGVKGGAQVFEKYRPNELQDMWNYARAAAMARGMDRMTDAHWTTLERQLGIPPKTTAGTAPQPAAAQQISQPQVIPQPPRRSSDWFGGARSRGGWFSR